MLTPRKAIRYKSCTRKQPAHPTSPQARLRRRLRDILAHKPKGGSCGYGWLRKTGQVRSQAAGNISRMPYGAKDKQDDELLPRQVLCKLIAITKSVTAASYGKVV
jgi:hypothetical protein